MKKILLTLVVTLFTSTLFAQNLENAIGVRLGNGLEMQYERRMSDLCFLKCNMGMYRFDSNFLLSCTYNWDFFAWDWTPKTGTWFLTAGAGGTLGVYDSHFNIGIAGDVAFGIKFREAPVDIALDYRPQLFLIRDWGKGFANICVSCVYRF